MLSRANNEGPTVLEAPYGGQFTSSTQFINTKLYCNTPHGRSTVVSLETHPIYLITKIVFRLR